MARHKETDRQKAMQETRRRLLEQATVEFSQHGYVGANINRISTEAGYSKGAVYNYFPSKRGLMLALIAEIAAGHGEFITSHVLEEPYPETRITRFYEAGFAFIQENLAQARVMVNNLYGPDEEFKTVMYEAYQPLFQFVAEEIITAGMIAGVFREVDPVDTAALIMTIYLGTGSQVNDQGTPWMDPQQVADFVRFALLRS
jgi:AcrR family transcriptional regulator